MIEPVLGKDVAKLLKVEAAQPISQSILSCLCMDCERVNHAKRTAMRSLGWSRGANLGWVARIQGSTERFGESW
jgi:hypothetical protein